MSRGLWIAAWMASFAVFVRRQDQFVRIFQSGLQFPDDLFLFLGDDIIGFKVGLDIDSQLGPRLFFFDIVGNGFRRVGQVADMPHAGQNDVILAEITIYLFGFGG